MFLQNTSLWSKGMQYQILFALKQSASKQVFKALRKDEYTGMEQEVLLKIFLKQQEQDAYREEFESLSQMSHFSSPYCIRLFGFENFGSKKALVLEYVRGVSLYHLMENFSLNKVEIRHILNSIYNGLRALHKRSLCHGDLSLNNVLIDEKAHIKLIDFGKSNYEKDVQGTPPFVAPEILKGVRPNFLSDLYALGVMEAVMRDPGSLPSLKNMTREDFKNRSSLLDSDPTKRVCSYLQLEQGFQKDLRSLSLKVKELLSLRESRRCVTLRNPMLKKRCFYFSRMKKIGVLIILAFLGWASPGTSSFSQGLVKIYTYEWFEIRIGKFKSYTPVTLPLSTGWHLIEWKNKKSTGQVRIFASQGKTLLLNDKIFLKKGAYP